MSYTDFVNKLASVNGSFELELARACMGLFSEYTEFEQTDYMCQSEAADVYFWLTRLEFLLQTHIQPMRLEYDVTKNDLIDLCEKLTRTDLIRSEEKKKVDRQLLVNILSEIKAVICDTGYSQQDLEDFSICKLSNRHKF